MAAELVYWTRGSSGLYRVPNHQGTGYRLELAENWNGSEWVPDGGRLGDLLLDGDMQIAETTADDAGQRFPAAFRGSA